MIKLGIDNKLIRLIKDPTTDIGTVCSIGDNWFYFGGSAAAESTPKEYTNNTSIEDIVSHIYETLNWFYDIGRADKEFMDEYKYYESYLRSNLILLGVSGNSNIDPAENLIFKLKKYQYSKSYDKKSENGLHQIGLTNKEINILIDILENTKQKNVNNAFNQQSQLPTTEAKH